MRVIFVLLLLALWSLQMWNTRHLVAWCIALALGIGRVFPFFMESRSGWKFWTICQSCRGPVAMIGFFTSMRILQHEHEESGVLIAIDFLFYFFAYALPMEIVVIVASLKSGRMVWVEDFVRPMTNEIARISFERKHVKEPDKPLTLEEERKRWREAFFHDSDPIHGMILLITGIGLAICWMILGRYLETLVAVGVTALFSVPLVWLLPRSTGKWGAASACGCAVLVAILITVFHSRLGAFQHFIASDSLYLAICITTTVRTMRAIAGISEEHGLTLDEMLTRAQTWYLSPVGNTA